MTSRIDSLKNKFPIDSKSVKHKRSESHGNIVKDIPRILHTRQGRRDVKSPDFT